MFKDKGIQISKDYNIERIFSDKNQIKKRYDNSITAD